ncbi:MAG TPA: hypothetical protein VGM84_06615 [Steroidobacteraceae bacterium]|jgi:hypothetical protein
MLAPSIRSFVAHGILITLALTAGAPSAQAQHKAQQACIDYSGDPSGCQPSTFPTPTGQMPSRRVGKDGKINPKSSEADARAGAALLERKLHLFRNITPIHWTLTVPSVKDPATGGWTGGDLDAMGDARGLGIAGQCVYVGHENGLGHKNAINIFKIAANPLKDPPVQVGDIAAMSQGDQGFDDRELRSLVYTTSGGQERQILVRNGGTQSIGRQMVYDIDLNTCLVKSISGVYDFGGQSHEFYLWHDPVNPNRILVYMTIWTPAVPDPNHAGLLVADLYVMAVTDEKTGEILKDPLVDATFTLQDAGGPRINEKPDATGLFSDGRFIDYSTVKNLAGQPGNHNTSEQNKLHSIGISRDGERGYVSGTTSGFYVLNTEAIAHHTDADLAAGKAGCNLHTTIVTTGGAIDATKLPDLTNDCLHMVVNDDPGLKAYLGSNAQPEAKVQRYLALEDRSRFDLYPPFDALPTGTHSAVVVPDRPAQIRGNTKGRPAYVWLSDENFGCPLNYARMVSVEQEAFPAMVGAFAIPDNVLGNCLNQAITEPDGVTRRRSIAQQNHNATVFKDLVFTTWYGHGLRVIDISNPMTPREVGHALPVPQGIARTYPIFKDGLMYWADNRTGLHVAKYTGPYANEIPDKGVYEGNATSPHK